MNLPRRQFLHIAGVAAALLIGASISRFAVAVSRYGFAVGTMAPFSDLGL
jgi:hypothetical protein